MTPVEDVLAKFRHRYNIIGSGGLRLHGIDWEEGDLDIWLDPSLSDEDWQASVDDAAGSLKRPWKRGEPDGSGGLRASTRIACSPPLDVMREVMGCTTEDFEKAFDNSLSLPPKASLFATAKAPPAATDPGLHAISVWRHFCALRARSLDVCACRFKTDGLVSWCDRAGRRDTAQRRSRRALNKAPS
jgi:hypothetical protein